MRATPTKKEVAGYIALIRRAAPRVLRAVFTRGGCYSFHLILRERFGEIAVPYTTRNVGGHVLTKIGPAFWDIRGCIDPGRRYRRMKPRECGRAARWCCEWDDLFH